MKQSRLAKKIALSTSLIYFFLSVFVMFTVGQHVLRHDQVSHHAAQHATFLCAWMCASSTHVFTIQHQIPKVPVLFSENRITYAEQVFSNSPLFSFYIRPPPFTIS